MHGKYLAMDEGNHEIGFMALAFSIRHDNPRAARHAHLFACSYSMSNTPERPEEKPNTYLLNLKVTSKPRVISISLTPVLTMIFDNGPGVEFKWPLLHN